MYALLLVTVLSDQEDSYMGEDGSVPQLVQAD